MNSILRRRRGLMAQGEKSIKLKDIPVASCFRTSDTSTTNYIFLGIINGTAWLLREQLISTATRVRNDTLCDYEDSLIDDYLTNTWIPSFSEHAREYIEDTTVTFPASDGTSVADKTITRKGFLLTKGQLIDDDNNVLTALEKYYDTTSAITARLAKDSGGTGRDWWTCTAGSTTGIYTIAQTGHGGGNVKPNTPANIFYRRPVVSFSKDTPVNLVNGIYILA